MAYRIIYGGNFINKGAEALTLTTVDMLRKKYPDDEPVLLDLFPSKFGAAKHSYDFKIVNMHVRTLYRMKWPLLKPFFKPSLKSDDEKKIKSLFNNAAGFYDISGYGISSHNQKTMWTLATMIPAFWARKHNIPVVLLPQSLGPFNFKGIKGLFIKPIVKKYLRIPNTIFIREAVSRQYLQPIRTKGVIDSFDIVLLNQTKETSPAPLKAIAVIPNRQLTNFMHFDEVAKLFASLADRCIGAGYDVHLFAHATDDSKLCRSIYYYIANKDKTTLYQNDFTVPQTEELLAKMAGVVTARYHGLVHAVKLAKPCFVIGWATKYRSLLKALDQEKYYIDLTNEINQNQIISLYDKWLAEGISEGPEILKKVTQIQSESRLMEYL